MLHIKEYDLKLRVNIVQIQLLFYLQNYKN